MHLRRLFNYLCVIAPPLLIQTRAFTRGWSVRSRVLLTKHSSFHSSTRRNLTVKDAYDRLHNVFTTNRIPEPDESARYLVSAAAEIGMRFSNFGENMETKLSPSQITTLEDFEKQRLARVPIQYIVGDWDFCGMTFKLRPPVLIPRPETEELVDQIAKSLARHRDKQLRILDVGCGSGVIGISLLKRFTSSQATGIDINPKAVELSNENAQSLNVYKRYSSIKADISTYKVAPEMKYDIIVSNPPYIPSEEMKTLEKELEYEDSKALDGGSTGLDVVSKVLSRAGELLSDAGPQEVWMEVSHSHPPVIEAACAMGKFDTRTHAVELLEWFRDVNFHPRFVRLRVQYKK